jgi:WD40 repeat protein
VQTNNWNKIYTCSYDGSVRCLDLEKQKFLEIFVNASETQLQMMTFTLQQSTMYTCDVQGNVCGVDLRSAKGPPIIQFQAHEAKISSIHLNPTDDNIFVTSSLDHAVKLWDVRILGKKKNKPLASLPHMQSVQSAFFSPNGAQLVSQSKDDYIRVWNSPSIVSASNLDPLHRIAHNNNTGRWVTNFRTVWDPKFDNIFVVGSMAQPRGCDVFDSTSGALICHMQDEKCTAIPALNVFHPSVNVCLSGNASGRVNVWIRGH